MTGPEESAGSSVFLSYARADQKRAKPIIAALEAAGFRVWWDGLLEGGDTFLPTTEAALESADAVVVLWSKTSVDSHWVRDEATRGRDRGCLVPLSLDGSKPPLGFRQFQVIDLAKWRGRAGAPELDRVVRAIAATAGGSAPVVAPSAPALRISRRAAIGGGVALATVAAGLGAWKFGLIGGTGAAANSIAVLPFDNLGGDSALAYFGDGLVAELRAGLARNEALRVVAQASSDAFRATNDDAKTIARRLGVAFLLGGNVRIGEGRVRITADLTDGASGFNRWTKTFEQPLGNALKVQEEIAGAVTAALTSEMGAATGKAKLQVGGTTSVAAYDAYLRGRDLYISATDEPGERAALARYDAALAIDPYFALAHAARARSLLAIGNLYGSTVELPGLYSQAVKAARRAVEIAPDYAEGWSTLGIVLFQGQLKIAEARQPFARSRSLGGGDALVAARFATFSSATGQDAAAREAVAEAVALDPLNPLVRQQQGHILYYARQFDNALASLQQALGTDPKMVSANALIGDALYALGRTLDARDAYAREPVALLRTTGLAIAEHKLGNGAAAQTARAAIVGGLGTGQLTQYQQAQIAAQWGEQDTALTALDAARRAVDSGLTFVARDPMLDPLRTVPAFLDLLKRLGFA